MAGPGGGGSVELGFGISMLARRSCSPLRDRAGCFFAPHWAGPDAWPAPTVCRPRRLVAGGREPWGLDARRVHGRARLRVSRVRTGPAGLSSEPGSLKSVTSAVISVVRTRAYRTEVAPQRLEREPLLVDLPHGAHPALAEERNGRAPALDGVLQQERRDREAPGSAGR